MISCNTMVRWRTRIGLAGCAGLLATAAGAQVPTGKLALGGNVNERFHWATPAILQQTNTTWLRGFIPASEFITGKRSYTDDEGLAALKNAAATGHKIVLSIKWDSVGKGEFGRMPLPNSKEEKAAFNFVDHLLDATAGSVSALVVVNELSIDTLPEDLKPDAVGQVPVIGFLRRVTDHLSAEHRKAADGYSLPIFTGGMTRLERPLTQEAPATVAMLRWVNEDLHVTGCDFHIHQPDLETTKAALKFMHRAVPSKPLMVTEFSMVWKWQKGMDQAIDASPSGKLFAKQYGVPAGTSVAKFIDADFQHPVTDTEWKQFLASQPWFDGHYLAKVVPMMQASGVKIATYALVWDPKPRPHRPGSITEKTVPWFLNQLLVPGMATSPDRSRLPENYLLFDDFVGYQKQ